MEIIVILAVLGIALYWFAFRKGYKNTADEVPAPYKVEATAAPVLSKPADERVEAVSPVTSVTPVETIGAENVVKMPKAKKQSTKKTSEKKTAKTTKTVKTPKKPKAQN